MKQGDVPRAVASGAVGSAVNDDRVRASRVAAVVGVFAAVFVFALYGVNEVPGRAVALVGGSPVGVARYGGVVASWQPPGGTDPSLLLLAERSAAHRPVWHRDGDHLVIELPGVTEANAPDVIERLGARLEFREVVQSETLNTLVKLGLATVNDRDPAEPKLDVDVWHPEDGGPQQQDYYLYGHDRAAIEAAVVEAERQGWTPPPNTEIAYEWIEPDPEMKDRRAAWRTYLLSTHVEVDGRDIDNAMGTYDPNTNRPIVLLDFTREGQRRFGDLTARIVGHKLATVLGGVVKSAPIINGPIRGGRASITMGGSDPIQMEHERDVLVETLSAGALSIGGTVSDGHWVAPQEAVRVAIARTLLAVVAGLVAAMLSWLLVRATRPERRRVPSMVRRQAAPERSDAKTGFGKKLAWTVFAILVYIAGTYLIVPGVNEYELAHIIWRSSHHSADLTMFSVFGLGFGSLVSSFVIVEVVASIVPPWRRLRDTVRGRRRLGLATAIIAVLTSVVQAYFITKYLGDLDRGDGEIFAPHMFWICVATYAAGPMCLAILASVIGSRGIGNGYAVLIVVAWLWKLPWFDIAMTTGLPFVVPALAIAGAAGIVLVVLGWRVHAPGRAAVPLPAAGNIPLHDGGGVLACLAALTALGVTMPAAVQHALGTLRGNLAIGGGTLLVTTVIWAFAFARPGRRRDQLAAVALEPVSGEQWLRAVALTGAALVCLFGIELLTTSTVVPRDLYDPLLVVFATAVIGDFVTEWRDRRRSALVAVWPLHDPLLVDPARDRLTAAQIPHHIQATRLRTLLWIFGAYAPMMVLVPPEHVANAHVLMRDWLEQ